MSGAGFYKLDPGGTLLYASATLCTPSGTYLVANQASYTYPIDGAWAYYPDDVTAMGALSNVQVVKPRSVTKAQAVMALYLTPSPVNTGKTLLDDANTAVAAAGGTVAIWWTHSSIIDRSSPNVAEIGSALNLSSAQVDALFQLAAQQNG